MKISIVTATYNSAATIHDTIESVLRQTYKNIEYIIIDGASKDDTLDIIRKYEPLFNGRLSIVSEPDCGIFDAMNKGIGKSTGDVVGILNSDDFFTSDNVIQKVVDAIEEFDVEAVYGDVHFVKSSHPEKCTRYYSSKYFRSWLLRFGFMPAHPSFYCKKEVFDKYGLYDTQYKSSADFDMMVRLFAVHGIKAKYLNMDFVTMRVGGESTAGLSSKIRINRDIEHSLNAHHIYTNQLFQGIRYLWRIGELAYARICRC